MVENKSNRLFFLNMYGPTLGEKMGSNILMWENNLKLLKNNKKNTLPPICFFKYQVIPIAPSCGQLHTPSESYLIVEKSKLTDCQIILKANSILHEQLDKIYLVIDQGVVQCGIKLTFLWMKKKIFTYYY